MLPDSRVGLLNGCLTSEVEWYTDIAARQVSVSTRQPPGCCCCTVTHASTCVPHTHSHFPRSLSCPLVKLTTQQSRDIDNERRQRTIDSKLIARENIHDIQEYIITIVTALKFAIFQYVPQQLYVALRVSVKCELV